MLQKKKIIKMGDKKILIVPKNSDLKYGEEVVFGSTKELGMFIDLKQFRKWKERRNQR